MKGFSDKWCALINSFMSGGSVAIKVNDDVGRYFKALKGLRQGDPLSLMLFNIVANMLIIMIEHAKNDGLIEGVIPHLVDGGYLSFNMSMTQFFFMKHDLDKAQNLKLIISVFQQLSGLKINFHKSELFSFGEALNEVNAYANLFGCGQGQFPMRYLGILIHYRRLTLIEWKIVEERLQKRLCSWNGKLLSQGGRLVLINLVLSNMVLHIISFLSPKGVLQKMDSEKKKYRLAK
jgi:hypothetical protein